MAQRSPRAEQINGAVSRICKAPQASDRRHVIAKLLLGDGETATRALDFEEGDVRAIPSERRWDQQREVRPSCPESHALEKGAFAWRGPPFIGNVRPHKARNGVEVENLNHAHVYLTFKGLGSVGHCPLSCNFFASRFSGHASNPSSRVPSSFQRFRCISEDLALSLRLCFQNRIDLP